MDGVKACVLICSSVGLVFNIIMFFTMSITTQTLISYHSWHPYHWHCHYQHHYYEYSAWQPWHHQFIVLTTTSIVTNTIITIFTTITITTALSLISKITTIMTTNNTITLITKITTIMPSLEAEKDQWVARAQASWRCVAMRLVSG